MAELSDDDRRAILGAGYKRHEVTEARRAYEKAAKHAKLRNMVIMIAFLMIIGLVMSLLRT